jgi:hypothetical protein
MIRNKIISKWNSARVTAAAVVTGLALALAGGCASSSSSSSSGQAGATTKPASDGSLASQKSGAQLWAAYCMRCHNMRSPDQFGPAQWEVVVHHMRQRANLTGQEAAKITEFLKSAS